MHNAAVRLQLFCWDRRDMDPTGEKAGLRHAYASLALSSKIFFSMRRMVCLNTSSGYPVGSSKPQSSRQPQSR